MTRDDIIELALKAGFSLRESFVRTELRYEKDGYAAQFCIDQLERFAALVAAAEREACARICDEEYEAGDCAAAIRARGES